MLRLRRRRRLRPPGPSRPHPGPAAAMGLLNFTGEPVPEAVSGDMHNLNQLSAQVRRDGHGGFGGSGRGWAGTGGRSPERPRLCCPTGCPGPRSRVPVAEAGRAAGLGPGDQPRSSPAHAAAVWRMFIESRNPRAVSAGGDLKRRLVPPACHGQDTAGVPGGGLRGCLVGTGGPAKLWGLWGDHTVFGL